MKVSAPHRGWTSGRATPSLRPTPYAAETANPAGRHLSFAEICPDYRSQLYSTVDSRIDLIPRRRLDDSVGRKMGHSTILAGVPSPGAVCWTNQLLRRGRP